MPLNAALKFFSNFLRVFNKIFVLQKQVQMIQLCHNHVVNAVNMKRKYNVEPVSDNEAENYKMSLQKVMAQVDDVTDERKFINPRQLEAVRQNYFISQNKHQNRIRKHENSTRNIKRAAKLAHEVVVTRVTPEGFQRLFVFISSTMKVLNYFIDLLDVLVSNPEGLKCCKPLNN